MMASRIPGRQVLCLMAFALLASRSPAGGGRQVVLRTMALAAEEKPLPPPPAAASPEEQYLVEHNIARAAVKVGPLRWSPKLATTASRLVRYQRMEKRCKYADLGSSTYGANQSWASFATWPAEAVRTWVEAGKYYNYDSDTCVGLHPCGTYKQVVWRTTAEVGCAQAVCGSRGPTLTICLYFPPGNFVGEKPY